jgi:hypothetical protein
MTFERQVDILVAILSALVAFVGCAFYLGFPISFDLLISAIIFLIGFFFGRVVWDIVSSIF